MSPLQRRFLTVLITACALSSLLWLSYWPTVVSRIRRDGGGDIIDNSVDVDGGRTAKWEEDNINNKSKIVILMWTHYYERKGDNLMSMILMGRKWDDSCCAGDVEVTLDRSRLETATAVVFFGYVGNLRKSDLPTTRRPDQLWVLFLKESPHLSPNFKPFNNLFNWTMTYRSDADIWAPYGESLELDKSISETHLKINGISLDKWVSGKNKLLAGVISHCPTPSKREDYVKLLRSSNLTVDIYGGCGKRICSRHNTKCNHTAWWMDLASNYKFYFAAENSICVDYITEKFWRALELGLVPVAYGGGNYSKEAPPNSFIDVRDFPTHNELIEQLLYLDGNDEEYRKYFGWRKKYKVRMAESWQGWCQLCKAVQEYQIGLEGSGDDPDLLSALTQVYSDLGGWWWHKPHPENRTRACSKPNFK